MTETEIQTIRLRAHAGVASASDARKALEAITESKQRAGLQYVDSAKAAHRENPELSKVAWPFPRK